MSFLKKLGIVCAVSVGMGILVLIIGNLLANGDFIQWEPLGKPPETITKIVGTTMHSVTVETSSNMLYTRDVSSPDNSWGESTEIPIDQFSDHFQCNKPELTKGMVDIQESCLLDPSGETESIFALRNDGNIYMWHGKRGLGEWGWMTILCFPFGAVIGFIGSLIYFFTSWLIKLP